MKHKENILKLRAEGKSYREIVKILGCSSATVSYHCGNGQKEKQRAKLNKYRSTIPFRVDNFKYTRKVKDKTEDFQRPKTGNHKAPKGKRSISFRWQDVVKKFGIKTKCYLTGRDIDLQLAGTYHFDHIKPLAKGGKSTIDNLGILCREANMAKSNLSVDEFITLCKEVLVHNGYKVHSK